MSKNETKIYDISAELEKEFGVSGTKERAKFDDNAYAFYTSQILLDARKEVKVTQAELASRIGTDKAYISRIEKGLTIPNVGTFYRIMNALGLHIEITKSIG
jgi:DNA-binding XRE family transcriptional regulator